MLAEIRLENSIFWVELHFSSSVLSDRHLLLAFFLQLSEAVTDAFSFRRIAWFIIGFAGCPLVIGISCFLDLLFPFCKGPLVFLDNHFCLAVGGEEGLCIGVAFGLYIGRNGILFLLDGFL